MKKKIENSCTIENGCPDCDGNIHDGTGTGWLICHDCGTMF